MVFSKFFKSSVKCMHKCHLQGHQDAILCLAVSNSGALLASGGFNGLRMWDFCQKVQLAQPPQIQSPQDPITAVAWLAPNNGIQETLCCRTALGYVAIWRQCPNVVVDFEEVVFRKISGGHEVMAIASDAGCNVTVFGMYNGDIGSACIDGSGSLFMIDNTISGFSLHRLSDGSCIRTYDMKPLKTYPKQVTFAEDGTVIVGGSDNGFIYVFKKNTRNLQQYLWHLKMAQMQTIMVYEGMDHMGIVAASSNNNTDNTITVWKKFTSITGGEHSFSVDHAQSYSPLIRTYIA
ncbi:WD40-repeat-containing domain protein [Pisolithus croceorrhizus]|nr:WD40-repeat-containing domain protein [Pisolithus croceorrhizus]